MPSDQKNSSTTVIDLKADDIKPIDEKQTQNLARIIAKSTLITANAAQRQIFNNVGLTQLFNPESEKTSAQHLMKGFLPRLGQQTFSTYPALCVREFLLEHDTPKYAISFITSSVYTAFNTPFDSLATKAEMQKALKKTGIEVNNMSLLKSAIKPSVFLPFYIRNSLTWLGLSQTLDDKNASFIEKIGFTTLCTAASAAISIAPHNIGNLSIKHSLEAPTKSFLQTWNAISQEILDNPRLLINGTKARISAMSGAAILLAPETLSMLTQAYKTTFDSFSHDNTPKPKSSPCPDTSSNIKEMSDKPTKER